MTIAVARVSGTSRPFSKVTYRSAVGFAVPGLVAILCTSRYASSPSSITRNIRSPLFRSRSGTPYTKKFSLSIARRLWLNILMASSVP